MQLLSPDRYAQLKGTGHLPSPRGVAVAIIQLLQRHEFPVDELVHLVQSDPAISGRLLKYANAAAYGRSRPLVSLQRAIVALGSLRVRDLVVGFSVLQTNRAGECSGFDYSEFWSSSLATAIACQDLARFALVASEENFTIGLLSRIGELGLATLYPDEYGKLMLESPDTRTLLAGEQEQFGFDHRSLAGSMLSEWGLPEILVQAVYHHEYPDDSGLPDGSRPHTIAVTLNFARALADVCVAEDEARWSLLPSLVNRSACLGIDPDTLGSMVDGIATRWREWGAMLQVQTQKMPPFAELLARSPPRPPAEGLRSQEPMAPMLVIAPASPETAELTTLLKSLSNFPTVMDDADSAVSVALETPPAVILVDLDLPGLDAPKCCHALRQDPLGNKTYVLVLARPEQEPSATQMLEAGADDVLLKPVTPEGLRLRLNLARRMMHLRHEVLRERQGVVRSASEFADAHRRLIQVAFTDPLTHLANRRHGLDFLRTEWAVFCEESTPLSMLMLDIDHFKQVNDTWGHPAGDAVLKRLAHLLASVSRAEDLAFRYGGEEFAMILPGTTLSTAVKVAERLRRLVSVETFEWEEWIIPVTVSIGVATATTAMADESALIDVADAALYQSKEGGRNRVTAARS